MTVPTTVIKSEFKKLLNMIPDDNMYRYDSSVGCDGMKTILFTANSASELKLPATTYTNGNIITNVNMLKKV